MKLLIAYDGSKDADSALDDLQSAGLPTTGQARVISVAEVWLPPADSIEEQNGASAYAESILRESRERGARIIAEAEILARFAAGRVSAALPGWDVTPTATYGSPGWEVVAEADRFGADLIVVGAQGQSFLSRLVLGSISQRVLTEAKSSVRVARGKIELEDGPARIIVGFDASRGSWAAVSAVAKREWKPGSEVRLINVDEPVFPANIGRFVTPVIAQAPGLKVVERPQLESSAQAAVSKLGAKGLAVSFQICPGNPKQKLIEEAASWRADCIFVGANAWGSRLERLLLGSTSAAVAARAHCSVEVVRHSKASDDLRDDGAFHGAADVETSLAEAEAIK
ncbi:MAG: hypothetical protein DMF63_16685 [Acidobacteria bacterium]|nr:MAG: hypothetical protein DMF63_16685 [Acidobacteriota bacterium]